MSKVDEELTRRLRGSERPVAADGVFEGLERRRSHRERARRVQTAMLAFAVLAATAGGFVALRYAFDADRRYVGGEQTPASVANGEIVFSREGADGHFHLYGVKPDGSGLRQITDNATNDTDPAVSPDGKTIAFAHELEQGIRVIATVPFDGGIVTWHTPEDMEASDPAWSSNGESIAFVGWAEQSVPPGFEAPQRYRAIFAVDATDGSPERLTDGGIPFTLDPTWSPGDRSIAFAGGSCASSCEDAIWSDLYIVDVSSTDVRRLNPLSGELDEKAPSWSPDGTRIAFLRSGVDGDEVWTIEPNGTDERLIATSVEMSLEPDLSWAPDGTSLLVSDGDWIYRIDATPEGDPREHFVQLVRGTSPSWQPIPMDATPAQETQPQPSPDADAGPDGYGFGIEICPQHVTWVTEQLDGLGGKDMAFVVIERSADGACPPVSPEGYLGIDLDEDQLVDMTYGPIRCEVDCVAFGAPDLDGDGRHEILLAERPGSVSSLGVYAIGVVGAPSSDTNGIVRVEVGEPGDPAGGLVVGDPVVLSVGGDEGWSYRLRCVDRPEGRFLIASSAFHEVDSGGAVRIHESTLAYGELRMIVVEVDDRAEAFTPDPLGPQPEVLCGTQIPKV